MSQPWWWHALNAAIVGSLLVGMWTRGRERRRHAKVVRKLALRVTVMRGFLGRIGTPLAQRGLRDDDDEMLRP